jgi:hypothetical protein
VLPYAHSLALLVQNEPKDHTPLVSPLKGLLNCIRGSEFSLRGKID